jgi:uncharacterized peroxidase-related enzyme
MERRVRAIWSNIRTESPAPFSCFMECLLVKIHEDHIYYNNRVITKENTMSSHPVSRFPIPEFADLPPDIQQRFNDVQGKAGFIPNIFLTLARRPEEFRAFFAYHDTLMDKDTPGLNIAEREMIVVATSARNQCQYCVIAHGAILRIRAKNPLIADQLASNYRKADISERQRAMLDFALKVSRQAETVDESDYQRLNGFGFDDEDIWDIGTISAFFGLSNRIVNLSSMRTNDEFYLMGRLPREKH